LFQKISKTKNFIKRVWKDQKDREDYLDKSGHLVLRVNVDHQDRWVCKDLKEIKEIQDYLACQAPRVSKVSLDWLAYRAKMEKRATKESVDIPEFKVNKQIKIYFFILIW
jgi:hypothetical protein